MSGTREVKEVNDVDGAKEKEHGVAAFFDLDGTLVALPSLERRLFRILRYRKEIPPKNYFLWLKEAIRLMPRGMGEILRANKMYLRGVRILDERGKGDGGVSSWHKDGHQAKGQASAPPRCHPRLPVPRFFAEAIERVVWHARQGHEIVFLSGTLEPLAQSVARALEAELAAREITVTIRVLATRLEERGGKWTGRVLGEAMFGKAKARAAKQLAEEMCLDLEHCYAYGDSAKDEALLAATGSPTAVNPSPKLARIAKRRGLALLRWSKERGSTQRAFSSQRSERRERNNQDQSPCEATRKEQQTLLTIGR